MDNPYSSPPGSGSPYGDFQQPMQFQPNPGYVNHVRVLGILMVIQGIAAALMGLFFVAYAAFLPFLMTQMAQNDPNFRGEKGEAIAKTMPIMAAVMGGFAAVGLIPGILQIIAGVKTYRFRGRKFAIAGLVVGLIPSLTCYCGPTAVALTVYGFIVLMNPQVIQAFEMRLRGLEPDQILASFYQMKPG